MSETPETQEPLKQPNNPIAETLRMMERNGTDELTQKGFVACVHASQLLRQDRDDQKLAYPAEGNAPSETLYSNFKLDVRGMGRIAFSDTTQAPGTTLVLTPGPKERDGQRLPGEAWKYYCSHSPDYSRIWRRHKRQSVLNSAFNVIISPGTETNPGNMRTTFPRFIRLLAPQITDNHLMLTDTLKHRVISSWVTLADFLETVDVQERHKTREESSTIDGFFANWQGATKQLGRVLTDPSVRVDTLLTAIRLGLAKPKKSLRQSLRLSSKKSDPLLGS